MLHSCAEYLTHTLYRHCPLSEEKRPVFVYGFELSLSTLSSILSIILLSIIFKNVYFSLLFLYIFFFLRLFSGGYHAPTYSRCFILTNAIFVFVYLLSEVIRWYKPLLIPFAILSCIHAKKFRHSFHCGGIFYIRYHCRVRVHSMPQSSLHSWRLHRDMAARTSLQH